MRLRRATRLLFAALGLAGLLTTAACGPGAGSTPDSSDQSWGAVQQRANAQGVVRWYSVAPPDQNDRLVKAFNEKYPRIRVDVTRGASELPTRVNAELQSGAEGADVFMYASTQWYADHRDALLPVDSPAGAAWPADQWAATGSAPVTAVQPFGMIVWNTEAFPQGFQTWQDLLRPDVRGKLGMRSVVNNVNAGLFDFLTRTQGEGYLRQLATQNPKFYTSNVTLVQAVASGEISVGESATPSAIKDLQSKGAPLAYSVKDVYAIPYSTAVLKKTHRPDAARVFLDFLMSKEGQEALNGDGYSGSVLPGVQGTLDTTGMAVLDESKFPPDVIQHWDAQFRSIFGTVG